MKRLVLGIAALLSISARAAAAPKDAHARAAESFEQARDAFRRKDYAAAAAAFEQAARFEPHPAPLLNAADAWERAGEPVRALTDCDEVLAMTDVAPVHAGEAEACRERLDPKVSTLEVSGPPTITMRLDGRAAQTLPARVRVAEGRHTVAFVHLTSRTTQTELVELTRGEHRALVAKEPPQMPPEPPTRPPRQVSSRAGPPTTSWVAFGAALASGAVAGTYGGLTLKAKDDFERAPSAALADDFERSRLVTNVALGIGAVATITGFLVWVLSSPEKSGRDGPSPAGGQRASGR